MEYAAYCVVAKDSVGKQISIAFLERVKADFRKRYGGGKADTAIAKSLNKEFGYVHSWDIMWLCMYMKIYAFENSFLSKWWTKMGLKITDQ